MAKRHIRLKEWAPNTGFERAPTPAQMAGSDGTLDAGPFSFKTDTDGFIRSGAAPRAGQPVVVIGDSVVECLFAHEGSRMTDHAEREARVPVLNGGVSGTTTLHALHVLTAKVLPLRPALVVLMNGILDANTMRDPRGFWTDDKRLAPIQAQGQEGPARRFDGAQAESQRLPIIEAMALLCDRFDIQFALATIPVRGMDDHAKRMGAPYRKLAADMALINGITRDAAELTGCPLLDAAEHFAGRSDLFYDAYHFNAVGAAEVGVWIGKQIARQLEG